MDSQPAIPGFFIECSKCKVKSPETKTCDVPGWKHDVQITATSSTTTFRCPTCTIGA